MKKYRFIIFVFLLLLPHFVSAQQMGGDPDADNPVARMLPDLIPPPQPSQSQTITGGGIAAPKAPQAPQAPVVPSTHMGGDGDAVNDGAGLPGALLGSLIPGLAPPPAPDKTAGPAPPDAKARDADFSSLHQADTATVAQVIDPSRIRLRDGRIVQLAGIDSADYDPYDPGPFSIAARNFLKPLLEGQQVRLYVTKDPASGRITRLGDQLAHVEIPRTGVWVQGALLAAGLARVRPSERNPEMAAQMIRLEDMARAARRGLWADPRYVVLTPDATPQAVNSWAIVEGRVYGAGSDRNVLYLNFGPDYRKDFTVGISSDVRRQLEAEDINPLTLAGHVVRVRGWLRTYNGPYMDLSNATWLEVITEKNTRVP